MSRGIAVVITTYDQRDFLAEAIESVLAQELQPTEIVVVDDGSMIPVDDIVATFPGVQHIQQRNQGVSAARNVGMAATTAPLVCFLDGDDRLRPDALQVGEAALEAGPELAMTSGTCALLADERGTGTFRVIERDLLAQPGPRADLYRFMLRRNYIVPPSTVLFRRGPLEEIGGWTVDDALFGVEDYELYLRLARTYPIGCHSRRIVDYRMHAGQSSKRLARMGESLQELFAREQSHTAAVPRLERARRSGARYWRRRIRRDGIREQATGAVGFQHTLLQVRWQLLAGTLLLTEMIDRFGDLWSN